MNKIPLFILLFLCNTLLAQELPQFIQDKIDYCNTDFSEDQVVQLKEELDDLEAYFINEGLLTDNSGASYRAVYKKFAIEGDINFETDYSISWMDTLDANCVCKLLTTEQLSQLNERHQKAAERITSDYEGDVNPGMVAQRIIDNLTDADFDLAYYRISTLLAFYRITTPPPPLTLSLPEVTKEENKATENIEIFLNEKNEIKVNGKLATLEESRQKIYEFIAAKPQSRGVALTASRSALYETYVDVLDMISSVYTELQNDLGDIPRNIVYREPKN